MLATTTDCIKKREILRFAFSSLFPVLFLTLASSAPASTTWYVNGVSGDDGDNCTSALTACKTITHAISRALSGDSIIVAAATYKENLTISKSLNVIGSSASTTIIDGGGVGTVVAISSANAHVNLSKLKIRNGLSTVGVFRGAAPCGGGILNVGTLTISSTVISGNHATVSGGGGICNDGATTVSNSTISGNQASGRIELFVQGGGVLNYGTLTINSSTISGNSLHLGEGGGIANNGKATINNSTISGNNGFLRGGGILGTGTTSINNSTIASNTDTFGTIQPQPGGGIWGISTIQNSIVANNSGGNCFGTISSKGYNLSSDGTCDFDNRGDLNNHDPLLGPLQNNGGPTQTMALLSGSPAIDAGNPVGCTDGQSHLLKTDQRGMPRHDPEDSGGCDMGAYERQRD